MNKQVEKRVNMGTWHRMLLIVVVGLLLLIGMASCSSKAGGLGPIGRMVPYTDDSFTVRPLTYQSATINMAKGATFEGYLTVRGGNEDIQFYIKDSYGNRVLDINKIRGRYDFSFQATSAGFHTFYLANSFDWFTSREVHIHYRVR